MATRSTILAGRIPRTEGPGGLQFIGSKSVGHDYIQRKWWFWTRLFREPAIPLFVPWKARSVQEIQLPWQTTDLWGIPNSWEESGHADGSQGARHVSEMLSDDLAPPWPHSMETRQGAHALPCQVLPEFPAHGIRRNNKSLFRTT